MKKALTVALLLIAVVAVAAIIKSGVLSVIIYFIMVGSLPGMDYSLSPDLMLLITSSTLVTVLGSISIGYLRTSRAHRFFKRLAARRAQLPRRRYAR